MGDYIKLLLIITLIPSCSSAELARTINTASGQKLRTKNSEKTAYSSAKSRLNSRGNAEESDEDNIATEPVMIGGSYLTCYNKSVDTQYGCRMETADKVKDNNFNDTEGFTFTGISKKDAYSIEVDVEKAAPESIFHWQISSNERLALLEVEDEETAKIYKVGINSYNELAKPLSLNSIVNGQVKPYVSAKKHCLTKNQQGEMSMGLCETMAASSGLYLTKTQPFRITELKQYTELPKMFGQKFIKTEEKGPYFQVIFQNGQCLAPKDKNILDQAPTAGKKWSTDTCVTDKSQPLRSQLFILQQNSTTTFIFKSVHHRTTGFLSGQKELCIGFNMNEEKSAIATKVCKDMNPNFGFSFTEGLPIK